MRDQLVANFEPCLLKICKMSRGCIHIVASVLKVCILHNRKMYCCGPKCCLFLKFLPYLRCFVLFLGFLLFVIIAFNIHFNVTIITFFAVMQGIKS